MSAEMPSRLSLPPREAGDVVADKYRIERLVGSGGMAWVFEATHTLLLQRVAIKVLRVDPCADNAEATARFDREARLAAKISGDATARIIDVGTLDDGSPFLVMEYLEGRNLEALLEGRPPLPVATAIDYALQACEGLAETHAAGIVHRDLKPSNLFVVHGPDGSQRVKLLDFGISKFEALKDEASVTATRALVGSPVYMSPEQMRSSRRVDRRTDIWSMGIILYELLTGRSPFHAATLPRICARVLDERPAAPRSLRPEIPRGLDAAVLRCLEKEPSRRFQTVAELARALAPFGGPDAEERARRIARILGRSLTPRRPARWRPGLRAVAVATAALTACVALAVHPSVLRDAVASTLAMPDAPPSHVAQAATVTDPSPPSPEATFSDAGPHPTPTAPHASAVLSSAAAPVKDGIAVSTLPARTTLAAGPAFEIPEFGGRE